MQYTDERSTQVLMPIMHEVHLLLAKYNLDLDEQRLVLLELTAELTVDAARSWEFSPEEWINTRQALGQQLQDSLAVNLHEAIKAEEAAGEDDE